MLKSLSFPSLVCGLFALQGCALLIVGPPQKGTALSWNQVVNAAQNRHLTEGSTLPRLTLRNRDNQVQNLSFPATLVFRGSCPCQDVAVGAWMEEAKASRVSGVLVCVGDPSQLKTTHALVGSSQMVVSCRVTALEGVLAAHQELPLAVHVDAHGTVVSMEGGNG